MLTLVSDDIGHTVCSLNVILLHITSKLRHVEKYFLLLTANFHDREASKMIILNIQCWPY